MRNFTFSRISHARSLMMTRLCSVVALACASLVLSFPSHRSLAGLSYAELQHIIPTLPARRAEPPPGPLNDTSAKLVNDKSHPWKPLRPGDMRGPCPGLNTLASHGVCPKLLKSNGMMITVHLVASSQRYRYPRADSQCSSRRWAGFLT